MTYQVAIIGGGPAGYTAAEAAGKAGLSAVLFEKGSLGGVCLNEGCIPTKTLLYSAKTYSNALHASKYAVGVEGVTVDLPKMIARKQKTVRKLVLGIKARVTAAGVTVVNGEAHIIDKNHIECGGETYECGNMIVCTGSETVVPPIPGLQGTPYWTHREALDNKELPQSLVVIGGGVIGMEFASLFCTLGTRVTVVEMTDEILGGIDKEVAAMLRAEYAKRGVEFLLQSQVVSVDYGDAEATDGTDAGQRFTVICRKDGEEHRVVADKLLLSTGRRPVAEGYGLENLNVERGERGRIVVDEHMMTSVHGVYVCGDLTGTSMLAHTAVREAEVAVNSIIGKEDVMRYNAIPGVVYTNPEVAGVGLTEETATRDGIGYSVHKLPMTFSGRFVAENEGVNGMCKLLVGNDGTVVGAHLLGNPASEIVAMAGMAITLGLKTDEWKKTVFPHPTVGEIFHEII